MNPSHEYGKFGGRVLRAFKADVPFIVDAEITAEKAETWPVANRKALFEAGKVEWYGSPEDAAKRTVAANAAVLDEPEETQDEEETKAPDAPKEPKIPKKSGSRKAPAVKKTSRTK